MEAQHLRPHTSLLWRGLAAIAAFFVPVFTVLYVLTVPTGPWPLVLGANLVVVALLAYSLAAYVRLGVWVSADGIAERGFFGLTRRYSAAQLGSTLFVNMYHGGLLETMPQLFVCDPDGRQVIRLRGQFWSVDAMKAVAETLDVTEIDLQYPLSRSELSAKYPGLLYWFERQPRVAALAFVGMLVASVAAVYAVLSGLGATFR